MEKLQSIAQNAQPELIYLQTSKSVYETDEDLWFKAYSLNPVDFTPSNLCKTLYIQLINEQTKQVIYQDKYEMQNGFSAGHIFLRDSLSEGNYFLEAYTGCSYFDDRTEFHGIKKIQIKKDMKPRTSFTAEFNKQYYDLNDSIKITLHALSEQKTPLYASVEATLFTGDKRHSWVLVDKTNEEGKVDLVFNPRDINEGLCVEAKVRYGNKEELYRFPVPCKKGNPIQFGIYPEGGKLVDGLQSKIAFKAVNIDGNPLDVKGVLFEDDTPIVNFESSHAGMGSMEFMPVSGKKYHIKLIKPRSDSTFQMPEIYQNGIVFKLAGRSKDYLEFIVSQRPHQKKETIYLRGQLRGVVYCVAIAQLNTELLIKMPLREFTQQGIAEFTLFNENLIPIAERLVYVNPDKNLNIVTTLNKERYETQEKATLKIKVTDEFGQPVTANLGVSVYDKIYHNQLDTRNILSHCLISTQLKGKIYDPGFYFDKNNEEREGALDLLLLTQGWRSYLWNEKNTEEYTKTDSLQITDEILGLVSTNRKIKTINDQVVMAFNHEKNTSLIFADSLGKFTITPEHLKLWQGDYIYMKPMGQGNIKPHINLIDPFIIINEIRVKKENNYPLPKIDKNIKEESVRPFYVGPNVIELKEVIIKGRAGQIFRDKHIGYLDSLAKLELNSDYLGVPCNTLNCPFHNKDRSIKPVDGESYTVLLGKNGEILSSDYSRKVYYGERTITYSYPKFSEEELLKMNNLWRVKGYHVQRDFYQPNYDNNIETNDIPDFRNTLIWAPSVITNEKGEASLEFYCSDINAPFIVNIEGVSNNGLLGSQKSNFRVFRKTK